MSYELLPDEGEARLELVRTPDTCEVGCRNILAAFLRRKHRVEAVVEARVEDVREDSVLLIAVVTELSKTLTSRHALIGRHLEFTLDLHLVDSLEDFILGHVAFTSFRPLGSIARHPSAGASRYYLTSEYQ